MRTDRFTRAPCPAPPPLVPPVARRWPRGAGPPTHAGQAAPVPPASGPCDVVRWMATGWVSEWVVLTPDWRVAQTGAERRARAQGGQVGRASDRGERGVPLGPVLRASVTIAGAGAQVKARPAGCQPGDAGFALSVCETSGLMLN